MRPFGLRERSAAVAYHLGVGVSLSEVVKLAAAEAVWWRPKYAQIKTGPDTFFVYVKVPEDVARKLGEVQRRVLPEGAAPQEIDHVTLVFTESPKSSDEQHSADKVHRAIEALRDVGDDAPPIKTKIQDWGYFDGASKNGEPKTALVALLDAPGLDALHVDMCRVLKRVGIEPSKQHSFTPHVTFGYLEHRTRADAHLEPLSCEFTIDKVYVANDAIHEIPLEGRSLSLGKAAAEAAEFSMNPNALRKEPREAPGKGETSAVVGPAPVQGTGVAPR